MLSLQRQGLSTLLQLHRRQSLSPDKLAPEPTEALSAVLDELVEDRGRYSDAFLLGMVHAQKGGGLAAQRKAAEAVLDLMQQQEGFGSLSGCMRG